MQSYHPTYRRRSRKPLIYTLVATLLTPGALWAVAKYALGWADARYVHTDKYQLRVHDDSLEHVYDDLRAYAVRQAVDSMRRTNHRGRVLQAGEPRP